jgi:hypothetical protein
MSAIWLDISGWIVITHDWPTAKKFSQRLAVAFPLSSLPSPLSAGSEP